MLRTIIVICFGGEALSALGWTSTGENNQWGLDVLRGMCVCTGLILFLPVRQLLSYVLSAIDWIVSGSLLIAAVKRVQLAKSFVGERIFIPASMPHMVALWIFITSACFLLGSVSPESLNMPAMPIPIPVPLDQLLSYNGFGLVLLAFCGVGIFVARKPREAMARLGWVKPSLVHVGIGIALIFVTFAYDAVWANVTHQMGGNLASKLTSYNTGTFTAGGGAGPSFILALATGLCAGIGEETLMRGALQPVFGILPAAILHGLLHGQFSHAPIFIVQVAGWSTIMGIVRRYTNTTTTIIGHAGFNFLTTFLFAFNP